MIQMREQKIRDRKITHNTKYLKQTQKQATRMMFTCMKNARHLPPGGLVNSAINVLFPFNEMIIYLPKHRCRYS